MGHRQQLDEVPAVEAEEAAVIGDVASQGDDVAGVLQAGGGGGERGWGRRGAALPAPPPLASSPKHPRIPGTQPEHLIPPQAAWPTAPRPATLDGAPGNVGWRSPPSSPRSPRLPF